MTYDASRSLQENLALNRQQALLRALLFGGAKEHKPLQTPEQDEQDQFSRIEARAREHGWASDLKGGEQVIYRVLNADGAHPTVEYAKDWLDALAQDVDERNTWSNARRRGFGDLVRSGVPALIKIEFGPDGLPLRRVVEPFVLTKPDRFFRLNGHVVSRGVAMEAARHGLVRDPSEPPRLVAQVHRMHGMSGFEAAQSIPYRSEIKDGDILDLGGGCVGVLVAPFPVVVCGALDGFYRLDETRCAWSSFEEGKYAHSVERAKAIAAWQELSTKGTLVLKAEDSPAL